MSVNFSNSTPAAVAGGTNVLFQTDGSGNISAYVSTSAAKVATVDLTAQSAAISATTLFTPTATGMFRISIYEKVTTAASVSSTLGGATGTTITYTDGTDSVPQSIVVALQTEAGASAINNAGNATTTVLSGSLIIYALTAVAIQYAIDYTSSGVTSMQFEAHLKCESL